MAYNTRLTASFYEWRFSNLITVNIKEEGYAGSSSQMTLAAEPVALRIAGSENISQIIRGTEATINILDTPDTDYSFLFTDNAKKFKVEIYNETGKYLIWAGFVTTKQLTIGLKGWNVINLNATDGLSDLANMPYIDPSTSKPYDGWAKQIIILARALHYTGLELNIISMMNLIPIQYNPMNDATDTFDVTYIQQNRFQDAKLNPVSCLDVIKELLRPYQATIRQSFGKWHIVRDSELFDTSVKYREFYNDGSYVGNSTYSPQRTMTNNVGSPLFVPLSISNAAVMNGNRSIKVVQDYGLRKSILPGYNFPANEFNSATDLRHFTISTNSTWARVKVGDDYIMKCGDGTNPNDYFESNAIRVTKDNEIASLKFSIIGGSTDIEAHTYVAIRIYTGALYYYWDGSAWQSQAGDPGVGGTFRLSMPKTTVDNPLQTEPIIIDPIPANGLLTVRFYDYQETNLKGDPFLSEILITAQFNNEDWVWYLDSNNSLIDAENVNTPEAVRLLFNDDNGLDSSFVFNDGIMIHDPTTTPTPTTTWSMRGVASPSYRLRQWVAQHYIDRDHPYRFDGQIIGQLFHFHESIKIPFLDNKIFVCDDVEVSIKSSLISGSFIEVRDQTETISLTETFDNVTDSASIITSEFTDSYTSGSGGVVQIGDTLPVDPIIDGSGAYERTIDNDYAVTGITLYSAAGATVKLGWTLAGEEVLRLKSISGSDRRGYSMFIPTPASQTMIYITITGTASVYITMTKYK